MKPQQTCKRLSLIDFFENKFLGSDLQRIGGSDDHIPFKNSIDDTDVYIYNADLYRLFNLPDPFFDKWEVSVLDYERAYKDGFVKGLEHLKNEEEISLSAYRNKNEKDEVIKQLRSILFEREFVTNHKGLLSVIKTTQLIWTYKNLYEVGYNNGILYSIDVFSNKVGEQIHKELTNTRPEHKKTQIQYYFLNLIDVDAFLNELKSTFPKEKGQKIRAIIDELKDEEILQIGEGEFAAFLRKLKENFKREIGEYQGIQNIKEVPELIKTEINKKLKPLIIKHKTK